MIYTPMRILSDFKIETSILFEEEITIMEAGTLKQLIDKCKVLIMIRNGIRFQPWISIILFP